MEPLVATDAGGDLDCGALCSNRDSLALSTGTLEIHPGLAESGLTEASCAALPNRTCGSADRFLLWLKDEAGREIGSRFCTGTPPGSSDSGVLSASGRLWSSLCLRIIPLFAGPLRKLPVTCPSLLIRKELCTPWSPFLVCPPDGLLACPASMGPSSAAGEADASLREALPLDGWFESAGERRPADPDFGGESADSDSANELLDRGAGVFMSGRRGTPFGLPPLPTLETDAARRRCPFDPLPTLRRTTRGLGDALALPFSRPSASARDP